VHNKAFLFSRNDAGVPCDLFSNTFDRKTRWGVGFGRVRPEPAVCFYLEEDMDDHDQRMRTYARRTADELLKHLHSRPTEEISEEQEQPAVVTVDCGTF
jgi:hypothetical protein